MATFYAKTETFEPPYESKHWGSEVIVITADPTDGVEVLAGAHLHDEALARIEKGGREIFFSHDISFRELMQEIKK